MHTGATPAAGMLAARRFVRRQPARQKKADSAARETLSDKPGQPWHARSSDLLPQPDDDQKNEEKERDARPTTPGATGRSSRVL
jgi:hypothetical protein